MASERPTKKPRLNEEPTPPVQTDNLEAQSEPVQYHCDYCRKDLSNTIRIRCAICAEFDLCIECFSCGVELKDHVNSHDYRIIDNMHFPFLEYNWSADEEQLMLEGLERYGLGNWVDVAEEVSTKDKDAVKEHYRKFYLDSPYWPKPNYDNLIADRERVKLLNSGKYNKIKRHDGVIVKKEVAEKPGKKGKEKNAKPDPPADPKAEMMNGYMPMRDEFEIEMYPNAEALAKDVTFEEDDTPEEREVKMTIVECYAYRLRERAKARKFVVERTLQDQRAQEKLTKTRDAETKEAHKQFKRFFQIMNPEEYEDFLKGLAKEKQIQSRIAQLQNYRRKGITTLADAKRYEEEKARRESDKQKEKNNPYNRKQRKQPLDLTGQAGVELLTRQERKLCEEFHMLPTQFLLAKEALLREYVNTNDLNLTRERARSLIELEPAKIDKVFAFLVQVGWANNRAHRGGPDSNAPSPAGAVKPPTAAASIGGNRPPAPPQYPPASKKRGRD